MTITVQYEGGAVEYVRCDQVEFCEDRLAYYVAGMRMGSVAVEDVVRIVQ